MCIIFIVTQMGVPYNLYYSNEYDTLYFMLSSTPDGFPRADLWYLDAHNNFVLYLTDEPFWCKNFQLYISHAVLSNILIETAHLEFVSIEKILVGNLNAQISELLEEFEELKDKLSITIESSIVGSQNSGTNFFDSDLDAIIVLNSKPAH